MLKVQSSHFSIWIVSSFLFIGWSVLLSRKALKRSSKELRDICSWKSEVPCIMSACLVSMEPDAHLRLMSDQYTPPDDRSGQSSSNCPLSTPKDATCTHILVFPTSAKAQVRNSRDHFTTFFSHNYFSILVQQQRIQRSP